MDKIIAETTNGSWSTLSDKAILRYFERGCIRIVPFERANVSTSSYDVRLGENYYRAKVPNNNSEYLVWKGSYRVIYNPYSENSVKEIWGEPLKAKTTKWSLENVPVDAKIIWLTPGETILAHTEEFIGGVDSVTTMLKARSSYGRSFIQVCKCAGWGDIGYTNRWTMEITNNSQHYHVPLIVGMRIAQVVFFDTEGTFDSYERGGKYQSATNMDELIAKWQPSDMLPRLYKDRELQVK
jgi:dCTP deaminase